MNLWAFALLSAVVMLGALLQVAIGFGLGMICAPVLAIVEPTLVPIVNLVLACVVTTVVLIQDGAHLDLRGTGWALLGRIPGTIAGAALVTIMSTRTLAVLVTAMIIFGVAASITGYRPQPTKTTVTLAGALSGLMGTSTSIGGPPMAMVWQKFAGPRLRSTMGAFFLFGSALSLTTLALSGEVDTHNLRYALYLTPAAAIGIALARPLAKHLDVRRTRNTAMGLALTGATILLIQQFG